MRTLSLCCLLLLPALVQADWPPPDKLPASKELPDPLVLFSGRKVASPEEWSRLRRPELQDLFQHYMYGPIPKNRPKVKATIEHEDPKALGGKATLREVSLTVGPVEAPKIRLLVLVPNDRKGPAPVFVGLNFCGNHALVDDPKVRVPTAWMYPGYPGVKDNKASEAGRGKQAEVWAVDQTIDRGYALVTFYNGDVDPDQKTVREGLRPWLEPRDTGTIAAWAWGIHRAIDYVVANKHFDAKKIIVVGHSRLGKAALLATAFDERIAIGIPHQAGCGGTAPSRGKVGESVAAINKNFPHWFNAHFKEFSSQPERLPFDQHSLAALAAPRPILFSNATEDTWANPAGQFDVLRVADPVYRFLGVSGLEAKKMPAEGDLSAGRLGYYIRPGKHSMTRGDWKVFLDFADEHLGKPAREEASRKEGARRRILLVGQGPDGHPAGTHEYMAGLKILAGCLRGVGVELITIQADGAWKEGPELLDHVDGAVLFLSEGALWMDQDPARKKALQGLLGRGGGLVVLHWAMGTREARHIPACLDLLGGCHGGPDRKYKVLETSVRLPAAGHPIRAGVRDFRIEDEFYYALKFPEGGRGVTPIVQADIEGKAETVGWAWERPGGGRAFGFSGLHFHANWKRAEYRRLVTQGVLWTVRLPIPAEGLDVTVDPALFELSKTMLVEIVTGQGTIEVELDRGRAPITVSNFLRYVDAKLYDGGQFHRTVRADNQPADKVKIAVIQAGVNPKEAKKEFPPIRLERTNKTRLKHLDGTISMARDGPDTATGDFFLCVGDQPELNFGGKRNPDKQGFAAFGRVVSGLEVVRKIHQAAAKGQTLEPPVVITSVRRKP